MNLLDFTYCQFPNTSLPSCWDERGLYHKIRICGEMQDENYIRLALLALVTITSVLSALSSYHLHKVSDYIQLYEKTKTFLFCFPTRPEVHRSVIFSLSKDDANQSQLKEMLERSAPGKKNQFNLMVNRPNHEGETPLHNSTKAGASKCTEGLLKAGAIPRKNFEDTFPQIGPQLNNQEILTKLQESSDMGLLPNYIRVELRSQCSTAGTFSNQLIQLFSLEGEGNFVAKQNCTIWTYGVDSIYPEEIPSHVNRFDFAEVCHCHKSVLHLFSLFRFRMMSQCGGK